MPKRGRAAARICYNIPPMAEPARVGIIMGSKSDWETMRHADEMLTRFGVSHECRVLSAHRTPVEAGQYAESAEARGLKIIIAAAGGAAHLAGVIAASTIIPVLACPMATPVMGGLDSLLAMVQMPGGIPVGTLAVGKAGAVNAALLAVAILALNDPELRSKLIEFRSEQARKVLSETLP
jgi:5-(carboxyamino)imidazole ribonucleotide mutase